MINIACNQPIVFVITMLTNRLYNGDVFTFKDLITAEPTIQSYNT